MWARDYRDELALALHFLRGAIAGASFDELRLGASNIGFFRRAFERMLCMLLCRECGRFIELIAAQGCVGKHDDLMRLHFEKTTRYVERFFATIGGLDANFAWLQRR